MRRRFLNVFAIYKPVENYVPLGRGHLWPQGRYLNLLVLGMIHAKYCPIWCSSSWRFL